MKNLTFYLLMAIFGVLTGCSSIEQATEERQKIESEPLQQAITDLGYAVKPPVSEVTDWNLYNWQAVDSHAAIIWIDAFHPYLFTLKEDCPQLNFAETIGVSNTGSIINAKFDAILVAEVGGGVRCDIDKIYPLEKLEK